MKIFNDRSQTTYGIIAVFFVLALPLLLTSAFALNTSSPSSTSKSADNNPLPLASAGENIVKNGLTPHAAVRVDSAPGTPSAPTNLYVDQDPNQESFTLTISANGAGTTDPAPGTYTYVEGTTVRISATPADASVFTGWHGAIGGSHNPVYLKITANQNLTANFSSDSPLPDNCSRGCDDATPVYPTMTNGGGIGNVTMYSTTASSGGACNYGETGVMNYAAINAHVVPGDNQGNWQQGAACGQCAEVTVVTSEGHKSLVVRIMDLCPDANCGIDLGGAAPGELMIDGFGRYEGQWRFVSCDGHPEVSDGPPTLDVFRGSNPWWSRLFVRNGATAVERITWQSANGERQGSCPRADSPDNTFEVPVDEVLRSQTATFRLTVHYVDGKTATASLSPDQLATPGSYPFN